MVAEDLKQSTVENKERQSIGLSGVLAEQFCVVTASQIVLATTFTRSEDAAPMLLPLADLRVIGHTISGESEDKTVLEGIFPLDNVAFLLSNMSSELRQAIEHLEKLTSGALSQTQMGNTKIRDWMHNVAEETNAAIAILDRMETGNV